MSLMGIFQFEILLGNIYRKNTLHSYWSINIFGKQQEQSILWTLWTTLSSCQRWDAGLGGSVVRSSMAGFVLLLLAKLESVRVPCKQAGSDVLLTLCWGTVVPLYIKKPSNILKPFLFINLPVALFHMFLAEIFDFSAASFPIPPRCWNWGIKYIGSIMCQW